MISSYFHHKDKINGLGRFFVKRFIIYNLYMSKIQIKNLEKVYPGGIKALKGVSIDFKKNQISGLIGFNGSGKTTTFNILARFIDKYKGEISMDNKPIDRAALRKISYLAAGAEPKNPIKAIKHLQNIASIYGLSKRKANEIIKPIADEIEFTRFLQSPIKALSKGNQQKIKVIASMLNPNAEVMFLDEPFDGLDPIMVKKIQKLYMSLKDMTIIITSHRMDVVQEMCNEFYVLKEGVLVSAKKSSDRKIMISVNKEVPLTEVKKMKVVLEVIEKPQENIIIVDNIKHVKNVQTKLIKSTKYVYSSLKERNLSEEVFEGYGV